MYGREWPSIFVKALIFTLHYMSLSLVTLIIIYLKSGHLKSLSFAISTKWQDLDIEQNIFRVKWYKNVYYILNHSNELYIVIKHVIEGKKDPMYGREWPSFGKSIYIWKMSYYIFLIGKFELNILVKAELKYSYFFVSFF